MDGDPVLPRGYPSINPPRPRSCTHCSWRLDPSGALRVPGAVCTLHWASRATGVGDGLALSPFLRKMEFGVAWGGVVRCPLMIPCPCGPTLLLAVCAGGAGQCGSAIRGGQLHQCRGPLHGAPPGRLWRPGLHQVSERGVWLHFCGSPYSFVTVCLEFRVSSDGCLCVCVCVRVCVQRVGCVAGGA